MPITDFNDLAIKTGPTIVGPEGKMLNAVQKRAYTQATLIGGRTGPEVFRSSPNLQDIIYLQKEDRGQRYDPAGLQVDFTNVQVGTETSSKWSHYYNYMAWSEIEIEQNAPSATGGSYRRTRYKEILQGKQQNLWQSMIDQMEDECWAAADYDAMRTTYLKPASIPYFITEDDGGLPLDATATQVTDVQGLNPNTAGQENWDNKRGTYSTAGGAVAGGTDILGQLIRMGVDLHYHSLPIKAEHGERETMTNVAFCSDYGLGYITSALRIGQDTWNSREMSQGGLMINGVAYINIPSLDSAALYDDGSSGLKTEQAGEGSGAKVGPRFYFVSPDALKTFFFAGKHFDVDAPVNLTAAGRPNDWIQGANIWNQMFCTDRRRLGIVSPSGSDL